MNYKIDIQDLDCQRLCAPRQPGEPLADFEERVRASVGKSILRVAFLDNEASTDDKAAVMHAESPFFDASDETAFASMLAECMTQMGQIILRREQMKQQGPSLILPGE